MDSRHSSENKEEKKPIARGSYGSVFPVEEDHTRVVKVIDKLFDSKRRAFSALREIKLLKALYNHPYVVKLEDITFPEQPEDSFNSLSLVFEKMDADLQQIIYSDQKLTEPHIQYFLVQLLCALSYLHSAGIVHRDLKPANILVNSDCSLKVCDFGFSREVDERFEKGITGDSYADSQPASNSNASSTVYRHLTAYITTRWYRAPEAIILGQYGSQVDMWGFGCILAELLTMLQPDKDDRRPLFMGNSCYPWSLDHGMLCRSDEDQLNIIFDVLGTPSLADLKSVRPPRKILLELIDSPKKMPQDLETLFPYVQNKQAIDLLKQCLVINPAKRLTADKALDHPFLQSMVKKFRETDRTLMSPFPISPYSIADKQALLEYHKYEKILEARRGYEYKIRNNIPLTINESSEGVPHKICKADLRKLIWDEIESYHALKITSQASPSSIEVSDAYSEEDINEMKEDNDGQSPVTPDAPLHPLQMIEEIPSRNHQPIPVTSASPEVFPPPVTDIIEPEKVNQIPVSVTSDVLPPMTEEPRARKTDRKPDSPARPAAYVRLSSTASAAGMYNKHRIPKPAIRRDNEILRTVCSFCAVL